MRVGDSRSLCAGGGAWNWTQMFYTPSSKLPTHLILRNQLRQVFFPFLGIHLPRPPQLFPSSPSSEASSKWLDAHYDPMANIHTFSACLRESLGPGTPVLGGRRSQMVL